VAVTHRKPANLPSLAPITDGANGTNSKSPTLRKRLGAYFTPPAVAETLVRWVVREPGDRLLDPACGDGRFLAAHRNSVGVECDVASVVAATQRTRASMIHVADFFTWAGQCRERFDCAAGNPPFIRYQHFACASHLTEQWHRPLYCSCFDRRKTENHSSGRRGRP
jgi:hypothetical protein